MACDLMHFSLRSHWRGIGREDLRWLPLLLLTLVILCIMGPHLNMRPLPSFIPSYSLPVLPQSSLAFAAAAADLSATLSQYNFFSLHNT